MTWSRRTFLRRAGGAVFAPSLLGLAACNDVPTAPAGNGTGTGRNPAGPGGYGPLAPSADCPELLAPEGFRLVRISEVTKPSRADSAFVVPQALDGMAAFPLAGGLVGLVRNHEIRDPPDLASPFGPNPYDAHASGGTTSLRVRPHRDGEGRVAELELIAEHPSLTGTHGNCAGGPSTWGSWLSCEEGTEEGDGRERPHGYVFDVPLAATEPVEPVPLRALGRFVHEAVAVDPGTGSVYLTEDRTYDPDTGLGAGFYRFLPEPGSGPGDWSDPSAGRLQALAVRERPGYASATGQVPGAVLPVVWVDVEDPDPPDAAANPRAVFEQAHERGAAAFQRLEGCWWGDDSVFFNATIGGDAGAGQVWQYRPVGSADEQRNGSGGQLVLVFESPGPDVLSSPDNITVSPRGGLVICEDNDGLQFLRGVTRRGGIFDFVRQAEPMAEFCGACFGPDGEILFFNIQGSGRSRGRSFGATYAMWGPWERGTL